MSLARVAVFGVAILAAAGAGFVALQMTAPSPEPVLLADAPSEPAIRLTEVLVTAKDVPMGAPVDAVLAWQNWPADGVGDTLIRREARPDAIAELQGSVARQSFFAGEPVREAKLVKSDRGFMSAILPSGKRAIAIQIAADTSAGGFILPNDHVDVIMSRQLESGRVDTETVLRNLRVLAIDQTVEDKDGERVVVGSTATIEVDPSQAEALTAAQRMADRLVLSLRSLSDSVPGSPGYAAFLLEQESPQNARIRLVRYGQASDITTRN
ncbi:Flp pilus assembly protein CpaB [Aureimonas mangrovi]|uniref:Flp pilus assembly protein CpaB n=1 Tax=Aureimonas mangrovi TaxID=2758041 RepID=UPI00163DA688|nr:Flp pilus assembly protein CpaB [Aureimonas mangrovi]